MERNCQTCQHRNPHGVCTNAESVFFGSRVDDGMCPVWGAKQQEPNKFAKYSFNIQTEL